MTTQHNDATQHETPFDPAVVQCLRVLARRGRLIREARERAAAEIKTQTTPEAEDLTFYDDKSLSDGAHDERGAA